MKRLQTVLLIATFTAVGFLGGCRKDPAQAKSEFVKSAEKYVADEKYN